MYTINSETLIVTSVIETSLQRSMCHSYAIVVEQAVVQHIHECNHEENFKIIII